MADVAVVTLGAVQVAAVKPAAVQLTDSLWRVCNHPMRSNTYLLAAPGSAGQGRACAVIDPGLDQAALEQLLQTSGWHPAAVLCTHGHFDHVGGAAWLQQRYQVPVYLDAADLKLAKMSNFLMAAFKLKLRISLPEFSPISGEAAVTLAAGRRFCWHALPGHTPGSRAIAVDDLLFSGDSLYARRTALSQLPGEDSAQLRASLTRLFGWVQDPVRVMPGHGDSATVAQIRAHNHELRAFMAAESVPCPAP